MKILRLVHPTLGLCCEHRCNLRSDEWKIRKRWKHTYGKMMRNCTIEVINDNLKRVEYIKTNEIFDSVHLAAIHTGTNNTTVRTHCDKKLVGNIVPYRYRWA